MAQPAHPHSSTGSDARGGSQPRRVLLGPVFADNPYTDRLIDALAALGYDVRPLQDPKTLAETLGWLQPGDVFHLQWVHVFTVGRHAASSLRGTGRLLKQLNRLRVRGVRVVWTVHNLVHHDSEGGLGGVVQRWAMRRVARACDALVVHGAAGAQAVREAYRVPNATIAVVDHPSYIGSYPAGLPQDEARRRLDLLQGDVVLAHVGQLRPYKGVDRLVEAFTKSAGPDACLLVAGKAGDGELIEKLRAVAAVDERVRLFEGYVPDDEIQLYMIAADAVVLPYERVFTSGSAALAGTFGRAVIAPAVGCLPDQIGDAGVLYAPDDAGALEAAIAHVCNDRAGLVAMGARARNMAEVRTWDALARGVASVY